MLYFIQLFSYQRITLNQFRWIFFIVNNFVKKVIHTHIHNYKLVYYENYVFAKYIFIHLNVYLCIYFKLC